MNTSFITPEAVRAEMQARYGRFTHTQERPGSSLHVINRVRARVLALRTGN